MIPLLQSLIIVYIPCAVFVAMMLSNETPYVTFKTRKHALISMLVILLWPITVSYLILHTLLVTIPTIAYRAWTSIPEKRGDKVVEHKDSLSWESYDTFTYLPPRWTIFGKEWPQVKKHGGEYVGPRWYDLDDFYENHSKDLPNGHIREIMDAALDNTKKLT